MRKKKRQRFAAFGKGKEKIMGDIQDILQLFASSAKKFMRGEFRKLLVYGPYVRGGYDENSGIDVMILTSLPENELELAEEVLYDKAFDFFMKYGVQIFVTVQNEEHFNGWLGALPYYDDVKREGVEIDG